MSSPLACILSVFAVAFAFWLLTVAAGWGRKPRQLVIVQSPGRGVDTDHREHEHGNFDVATFAVNAQSNKYEQTNFSPVDSSDGHKAHNNFWDRVEAGEEYLNSWRNTSVEIGEVEYLEGNGK